MPDDIRLQRIIDLTRDLILIPSTEHAPAERKRVMQMLQNRLDGIPGIRFQWHEHRGSESLVVLPEGIDAPEILLSGHIDVVHHGDESVYRSEVAGGRIVGPGAGDMKGQVAILVALLAALHRRAPGVSVGLAITSDEEVGGEDGMGYLFGEAGLRCGVLIHGAPLPASIVGIHPGLKFSGRQVGEGQEEIPNIPLRIDGDHRYAVHRGLLQERQAETRFTGTRHPQNDTMGHEILGVVEHQIFIHLLGGNVVLAAQEEGSKLFVLIGRDGHDVRESRKDRLFKHTVQ